MISASRGRGSKKWSRSESSIPSSWDSSISSLEVIFFGGGDGNGGSEDLAEMLSASEAHSLEAAQDHHSGVSSDEAEPYEADLNEDWLSSSFFLAFISAWFLRLPLRSLSLFGFLRIMASRSNCPIFSRARSSPTSTHAFNSGLCLTKPPDFDALRTASTIELTIMVF